MKERTFLKCLSLVLAVFLALPFSGCRRPENPAVQTGNSPGKKRTIGISFPTLRLAYRATMKKLVEEAYRDDPETEILYKDADGSQEAENQNIIDFVDAGVDGIVLIPYTVEGSLSAVEYANERGVPVITVDNTLEKSGGAEVLSYVGADHFRMGEQAAELLIDVLEERFPEKESWKVIELAGSPGASGTVDREAGIGSVLAGSSRVELLAIYNAEFTTAHARSVMEDCLKVYEEIDGIICQNDLMALGCYEALKEAGRLGEIVLIGIDGPRDVVEKMASGGIDGTVIQYPEMILTGMEKLLAALGGEKLEPEYIQETDKIRAWEAEEYLEESRPW